MSNRLTNSGIGSLALLAFFSCSPENNVTPPNIIVFIADDISWDDFGCYGNEVVQSPNIDRISSDGILFTNVYLTASSCSPSRISILTGRYPHNTGACELHTEPPIDLPGFVDILRENGYYCGQAGKWHAGEFLKSGFDTLFTTITMNGGEADWLQLVENRPLDKPFFMWLASIDAHRDWGENDFSGTHNPDDIIPPVYLADGEETRKDLAQYYDEIKRFDYYIGEVENLLATQGVLENTIFLIMADNGRPFPGCKTRVYDRGMKTPFIVRWENGIVKKGSICESLVSVIDLAPTILELAGIKEKPIEFQGRSFTDLLKDPTSEFRKYVFSEHNWHDYEAHERMVRTKDFLYVLNSRPQFPNQGPADAVNSPSFSELKNLREQNKLSREQLDIFNYPRSGEELYFCESDPLQLDNIAGNPDFIEKQTELFNTLIRWMEETGDNVPENLTKDNFDRFTGTRINKEIVRGEMPGSATNAIFNNNPGPF